MHWDFFIAHAAEDKASARSLWEILGTHWKPFLDAENILPGETWDLALETAQQNSSVSVLLLSKATNAKWYLRDEIVTAISLARRTPSRHVVIPVYLDGPQVVGEIPYGLRRVQGLTVTERFTLEDVARALSERLRELRPDASFVAADSRRLDREKVSEASRFETYEELCGLDAVHFEIASLRLGGPDGPMAGLTSSQPVRALDIVQRLGSELSIHAVHDAIVVSRSGVPTHGTGFVRRLSEILPWVTQSFQERGLLTGPPVDTLIRRYLTTLEHDLIKANTTNVTSGRIVSLGVSEVPVTPMGSGEYEDPGNGSIGLRRKVRQTMKELEGLTAGGNLSTAQVAQFDRRTRQIQDVLRLLKSSRDPVVLLGDPGSGKSVTLREVARRIATREMRRYRPRLPIFVRLSSYRGGEEGGIPSPWSAVLEALGPERGTLAPYLPLLLAQKRLVIFFDGMDEMERQNYRARVAALSKFALDHRSKMQCVFSCRINDFTPDFEHRQIVLLPFTTKQVGQYFRWNFPERVELDGRSMSRREVRMRLENDPTLAPLSSNPLTLFLLCSSVSEQHRWPDGVASIYDHFLARVVKRLRLYAPAEKLVSDDLDILIPTLSHLAFEVLAERRGTVVDLQQVKASYAERANRVVALATLSGLLEVASDDGRMLRFTHHRIQEFLAARYIVDANPAVDWARVIDEPRWQETLLSVLALGEQDRAMESLAAALSFRPGRIGRLKFPAVRSPDTKASSESSLVLPQASEMLRAWMRLQRASRLDTDTERRLADRTVLASSALRQSASLGVQSPQVLRRTLRNIRWLSTNGRPTTQVRMVWAWRNVFRLLPVKAIAPQMDSKINWVRDQAIQVIVAIQTIHSAHGQDFISALLIDAASGRVWNRLKAYLQSSSRFSIRAMVSGATILRVVYALGLIALTLAFLRREAERDEIPAWNGFPAVFWLIPVLVILGWIGSKLLRTNRVRGLVWSALVLWLSLTLFRGGSAEGLVGMIASPFTFARGFELLAFIGASLCWFWFLMLCLAAPSIASTGTRLPPATFTIIFEAGGMVLETSTFAAIATIMLVAGAIQLIGITVERWPWLKLIFGLIIATMVVVKVLGGIRKFIQGQDSRKEMLLAVVKEAWIPIAGCVAVLAVITYAQPVLSSTTLAVRILTVSGVIIVFCLFGWLFYRTWRELKIRYSSRGLTIEEWTRRVRQAKPDEQDLYLRLANYRTMKVSSRAFANVLESLEEQILKEPAASTYWSLRHQLELMHRQDVDPKA